MKAMASAITAHGDTVRTAIGSITVPTNIKSIVGIWCYVLGGPGLTTLENLTGIFDLRSDSVPMEPLQLPLEGVVALTNGVTSFSPRIWNCNIGGVAGAVVTAYVTLDMAQTVAGTCRWGLIFS